MKKYVPVIICVLFVMLASTLRHIILPHAKSAAVRYGNALRIAEPIFPEEADALSEFDV